MAPGASQTKPAESADPDPAVAPFGAMADTVSEDWRAWQDSNLQPTVSKTATLSN